MSETMKSQAISRRKAFVLLGWAAALSAAVPVTMLTATDADAETQGMKRRDDRRKGRQDRRTERHDRRTERRQ